jgi:Tfp pilus assembly protein FimT
MMPLSSSMNLPLKNATKIQTHLLVIRITEPILKSLILLLKLGDLWVSLIHNPQYGDKEKGVIFIKSDILKNMPKICTGGFMHACRLKKDNQGFSMVEFSLAIATMAILAGLAIPRLSSSMRDMQLIADARKIATTLSYAKLSAASQMAHYRVSFDLNNNQWALLKLNRSSGNFEAQGSTNRLSMGVSASGIAFKAHSDSAPAGFSADSSATITFNSRGIPVPNEGAGIVYISGQTNNYAVTVSLSGKVQLLRFKNNQWVSQ